MRRPIGPERSATLTARMKPTRSGTHLHYSVPPRGEGRSQPTGLILPVLRRGLPSHDKDGYSSDTEVGQTPPPPPKSRF